ncbi:hypothetical protein [Herbiconiux sp. YIM B11900]|uniref:hypothetical protein n=1 Tax=Herbiconiux sp. YIM B11900 TaxID=3404131 RepID=UPI003F87A688
MSNATSTKPTAAVDEAAAVETTRAPSRVEALAILKDKGYTGPTSFTVTALREILAWFEVGTPKDAGSIPTGVLYAVHPDLRPAKTTTAKALTKHQEGYQAALSDIAAFGNNLKAIQAWLVDNRLEAAE